MSTINVSDLSPAGADLFQDSESFLNELSESELAIAGGAKRGIAVNVNVGSVVIQTLFTVNTNTINANTIGTNNSIR